MMLRNRLQIFLLAFTFSAATMMVSHVGQAATLLVINNNGPGVGFNDPTPAAPVGGNTGTTIGQQRLIAFQFAANIWASRLTSNVTIRVSAQFTPLACNATSAVLGSAGPTEIFRDFAGAPVASTWFAKALADALAATDLDAATPDINANFSSTIGTPGCLETSGWYYGLDGNSPVNRIDLVTVLLHEMGHGLGSLTFVNLATGAKLGGLNDTFMLNLENHGASPPDYPSMTDAQRVAASISTGNLHWTGANVRSASGLLTAGTVGDHVRMFAPNPAQPGSSVSHWDQVLTPNQLMEPIYTVPLHNPVLELPLFRDIAWTVSTASRTAHDFSADFKSDILWYNTTTGEVVNWLVSGASVIGGGSLGSVGSPWSIVGQRDLNGDGRSDILWRNGTTGQLVVWFVNGTSVIGGAPLGAAASPWIVDGTGDFNGDGFGDVLWRNTTTGQVVIWLLNGATVIGGGSPGTAAPPWTVAGTGDFNADGTTDILWRDTTTGQLVIWLLNGATVIGGGSPGGAAPPWTVAGTGDFNGDGFRDILWYNSSTGQTVVWLVSGASVIGGGSPGGAASPWTIAVTGDFNADGFGDILWYNSSSGQLVVWLINGTNVIGGGSPGTATSPWLIQGMNAD
jgi:hypothetical protein